MRDREKKAPLVLLAGGKGRGVDGKSDTHSMSNLARPARGAHLFGLPCTCYSHPWKLCQACGEWGELNSERQARQIQFAQIGQPS